LRQLIEEEKAQRQTLESYIIQLKKELLAGTSSKSLSQQENEKLEQINSTNKDNDNEEIIAVYSNLEDNECVLVDALKQRLQIEKEEREQLNEITQNLLQERDDALLSRAATIVKNKNNESNQSTTMEGIENSNKEKTSAYSAPAWIKGIDLKERAKTLRERIAQTVVGKPEEQDEASEKEGEARESVSSNNHTATRSNKAIRARETAFGKVDMGC
jgi:hypothetical protein